MAMSLTFLGASGTVTGSKYLLTVDGRRLLVDAGLYQGEKQWRERNWEPFPVDPASISDILVTHAHLDHVGYLPALVKAGFSGRILATADTCRLAAIVLMDAAHLQERETQKALAGGYSRHDPPLPLYTVADAEATVPLFRAVDYETDVSLGDDIVARWTRAGHILGSASILVWQGLRSVLFSGDLGRHDHPLLRPREIPHGAPIVLIESTYGDREHPEPDGPAHEEFAEAVRRTIARGGSVLVASFAVDRAQSVLQALAAMVREGRIPRVPIYLNSPMAIAALDVYRKASDSGELRPDLEVDDFMRLDTLRQVDDAEQSRALNTPGQPCIIVSSSGMATGGRVVHHLEFMLPDPRHTVVFTGYQGVGTRGRQLIEGATQMKFRGRYVPVRAEIVRDAEFSVHADASDLIDWLAALDPKPSTVFCVHGEPSSAAALATRIHTDLGLCAVPATYRETIVVEAGPAVPPAPAAVAIEAAAGGSAGVPATPAHPGHAESWPSPTPRAATPSALRHADDVPGASLPPGPRARAATHDDDADQVRILLETALGQVPFLADDARAEVEAGLRTALARSRASEPVMDAVNQTLYVAARHVDSPGGQSIVALLGHIPRVLGMTGAAR